MTLTQARDLVDTDLGDTGLQLLIDTVNADRPIPACAGEPVALLACWRVSLVYPRVCGGTKYRLGDLSAGKQPDKNDSASSIVFLRRVTSA